MNQVLEYIKQSFEDEILSKGEKRGLKEVIQSKKLSKRDLDWLRSQIFDLANTKISGFENEQVLSWLEKTNKLLLPSQEENSINKVYFSPGDDCLHAINNQIESALHTILICVFTISDDRITEKLIRAHKRGIKVKIITDNDKCNDRGSDIYRLSNTGIEVKIDDSPYHMHNKFAVFDKKSAITGSYNWTRSAEQNNQENILVTTTPSVTLEYLKAFEKLWEEMVDYK